MLYPVLYGLVQASVNIFLQLRATYEGLGFKQSKSDPCIFLRNDMIIVIYKDYCRLYTRDTSEIETFVKIICDEYTLTINDPDPIDDFLGIHFSHKNNRELHMSQTWLIDAVTDTANITRGCLKTTPAPATAISHANKEGLELQESLNNPPLIGQLKCIAQSWDLYMKKKLNEWYTTCNAQDTNLKSLNIRKISHLMHTVASTLPEYGINSLLTYENFAYPEQDFSLF
jgi:hypothetical protein